jgi:topoisomerase IV subunit B
MIPKVFKKAVGLNGVGSKAVNALSSYFRAQSVREGKIKIVEFERGDIINDQPITESDLPQGTEISFIPDDKVSGIITISPNTLKSCYGTMPS